MKNILLSFIMFLFAGCEFQHSKKQTTDTLPRMQNTILFIGDGMGYEQRKAARWSSVGFDGALAMDDMPIKGELITRSYDNPVTDSAAAATAMATGEKTNNGVIGLNYDLGFAASILEKAILNGKSVGLVTTTQITHATPASFAAHVESRSFTSEISEQLLIAGVDVLLGGGESEFLPIEEIGCNQKNGKRTDNRNLITEAISIGYVYVCNLAEFDKINPSTTFKLLGLFSDDGLIRPHSPSLANMTKKAIDILSQNTNGFFLMVEGGQIDWASHANNARNTIQDTIDFDNAVKIGKQFYLNNQNSLIIVTADHETGGMRTYKAPNDTLGESNLFITPSGNNFYISWSTKGHTSENVPLTAIGPGSELFRGTNDNTIIHNAILNLF